MAKKGNNDSSYIFGGPHQSFNDPTHHDDTIDHPSDPKTLDGEGEPDAGMREYLEGNEPRHFPRPTSHMVSSQNDHQAKLDIQLAKRASKNASGIAKRDKRIGMDRSAFSENDASLKKFGYGTTIDKE